jgi:hypothetical protein
MLFNDTSFVAERPEISSVAVKESLEIFEPGELLHERDATKLMLRWNNTRSKLSVTYTKWSKSAKVTLRCFLPSRKKMTRCCMCSAYSTENRQWNKF